MKPKNIEEAKALVERYESITIEEIEAELNVRKNWGLTRYSLTGFGHVKTCSLCLKVGNNGSGDPNCNDCIYSNAGFYYTCHKRENTETYDDIGNANTSSDLLQAYRNRAEHIKSILKRFEDENN